MIKLKYRELRTGDLVVCGGRGPTAAIIRRVTVGRKAMFNRGISCHTGIVLEFGSQFFIAEMLAKGLTISPFSRYLNPKKRRFLLNIRRAKVPVSGDKLLKRIAQDYRNSIEYDWKGDVGFVIKKVKQNPKRFYCSEYVYHITKTYMDYPERFGEFCSPHDLQVTNRYYNLA